MKNPFVRIAQRYFVPRLFVTVYYFFRYGCLISRQSNVQFSNAITFGKGSVVKPFAVIQTQGGRIAFGKNCAISSFNHISTGVEDVVIGDAVRIAPNVTILGGSRNFKKKDLEIVDQGSHHGGLRIERDVLVGAGAVILPGCRIGEGAVIGAGSVVDSDIPPYAIVAGVPATVIGERV